MTCALNCSSCVGGLKGLKYLQCVAVCGSVLQCVAVCCSVTQCVAVCIWRPIRGMRP